MRGNEVILTVMKLRFGNRCKITHYTYIYRKDNDESRESKIRISIGFTICGENSKDSNNSKLYSYTGDWDQYGTISMENLNWRKEKIFDKCLQSNVFVVESLDFIWQRIFTCSKFPLLLFPVYSNIKWHL